jgi:hypothetical protein
MLIKAPKILCKLPDQLSKISAGLNGCFCKLAKHNSVHRLKMLPVVNSQNRMLYVDGRMAASVRTVKGHTGN